ncbi:nicotinamide riboside kinase 1 isoform X2 [Brevipalpus obovatus]|uniref:nicotinamide riboside kinase 1 isoform X2 n=1 Tax=Brevipalpus obovatus TaxID=246614 RepID=UPI003D9DEDFC
MLSIKTIFFYGIKHQNWEATESIDWKALDNKIISVASQMSKGFLMVEGHLLFNYAFYTLPFDYKFFLTLDERECSKRRAERVYIPADPEGYFDECIWPMYIQNKMEMEKLFDDIVYLDGGLDQESTFKKVVEVIESQESKNRFPNRSNQIQPVENPKDIQAPNESQGRLEDRAKT